MSDTDVCRTCKNTRAWHSANHPRHPFKPEHTGSTPTLDGPNVAVTTLHVPHDPILRLALINKNVITPDDLADAEKTFKYLNGGDDGRSGPPEGGLSQGV